MPTTTKDVTDDEIFATIRGPRTLSVQHVFRGDISREYDRWPRAYHNRQDWAVLLGPLLQLFVLINTIYLIMYECPSSWLVVFPS
jgi:hypothetical protein